MWKRYKRRQLGALQKLLRLYRMLMDICLPKFDIYQGKVAPNCFKSYTNSWFPDFFFQKKLSDVRFDIHLVWRNTVSTGQSVRSFKKNYIQAWRVLSQQTSTTELFGFKSNITCCRHVIINSLSNCKVIFSRQRFFVDDGKAAWTLCHQISIFPTKAKKILRFQTT